MGADLLLAEMRGSRTEAREQRLSLEWEAEARDESVGSVDEPVCGEGLTLRWMPRGFRQGVGIEHASNVGGGAAAGGAVEGHSSAGCVIHRSPLGFSIDGGGAAGWANQRFLVTIRRDQNQCFRRPKLLDAPASHGQPFRQGRLLLPRPLLMYGRTFPRAKPFESAGRLAEDSA
jgi:hypothetical protein